MVDTLEELFNGETCFIGASHEFVSLFKHLIIFAEGGCVVDACDEIKQGEHSDWFRIIFLANLDFLRVDVSSKSIK